MIENGAPLAVVTFIPGTLQDLLTIADLAGINNAGMLKSTAGLLVQYLGRTSDAIYIDDIHSVKENFVRYLRSGKYAKNSVKSYRNFVNILLKLAEDHGWTPRPFTVPAAWQAVWNALPEACHDIIRFAIDIGKSPKTLTEDDLTAWRLQRAASGKSLGVAEGTCARFRTSISKAGLTGSLPLIKVSKKSYGLGLMEMELDLRAEIDELVRWKTCAFQPGRPAKAHVRPITAKGLIDHLCRMVGYAQNIMGRPPLISLRELVTPEIMESYVAWVMNERKLQGQGVVIGLGMLQAAITQNPRYKDFDVSWLTDLARQLPFDSETAINDRKARKYISYEAADAIPAKIRKQRVRDKQMSPRHRAIGVRNELMMTWLLILPWRQRNIRECRISGTSQNLFRDSISPFSNLTKPNWIMNNEKLQPGGAYWQFRFKPDETKTGNEVHAFLPSELVQLLEEYLRDHRALLVGDRENPMTLFVTDKGEGYNREQLADLVKGLAAAHAGRATTPHLYRDIVAFEWLTAHPEDYLTLSKLLWHRNIQTTLKKYGRRFDESTGVARMDDWRASRLKATA